MRSRGRLLGSVALVVTGFLSAATAASAGIVGTPQPVASGLNTPWDVVLLPEGRTLVTERPGRVKVIEGPGTGTVLLDGVPGLTVNKFLGLVPHPGYATNRLLYLYVNDRRSDGVLRNRIVRVHDEGSKLTVQATVFDEIDSDGNHDGGRMAFGPDAKLYVTTGDVHQPDRPQDRQSLNGKILRLEAPGGAGDGDAPADNPFVTEGGNARFVWSYGHRHPQGLGFDGDGRLYESEHGPSGETYGDAYPGGNGRGSRDEVNLIERGANYGWPIISGDETRAGMLAPIATSGTGPTWAPGGLAVGPENRLYVTMLAGQHLRELTVAGATVSSQVERYKTTYGRLRAAAVGCRGLYFTQDGASVQVLRVALDPAPPCAGATPPTPEPPPPGDGTPTPAPLPTPTPMPVPMPPPSAPPGASPAPGGGSAAPAVTDSRPALARLLQRATTDVRTREIGGLLRTRRFRARTGGFAPGRVVLRLTTRTGRTLATGRATAPDRRTVAVTVALGPRARAALRGRSSLRVVLRAEHVAVNGSRVTATRRLTLRR